VPLSGTSFARSVPKKTFLSWSRVSAISATGFAKPRLAPIASTQADVEIAAPNKHVLLTAQGAYLKLEGGDIELKAPGTIEFKASNRELTTPKVASGQTPAFGEEEPKFCELGAKSADAAGAAVVALD